VEKGARSWTVAKMPLGGTLSSSKRFDRFVNRLELPESTIRTCTSKYLSRGGRLKNHGDYMTLLLSGSAYKRVKIRTNRVSLRQKNARLRPWGCATGGGVWELFWMFCFRETGVFPAEASEDRSSQERELANAPTSEGVESW